MAQVATKQTPQLFDRAEADWRRLVDLFASWDALDPEEQLLYIHEAPLYADRLGRLVELRRQDRLSDADEERLESLLERAARLCPQLRELTGYDLSAQLLS